MSIWVEIVFVLILLSTIVLVIAENKHPVKTLAWLMVLVFLPVVGLVIYFLFGIDKKHRRVFMGTRYVSLHPRTRRI